MYNEIINWFKNIIRRRGDLEVLSFPEQPEVQALALGNTAKIYLNDASTPNLVIEKEVPITTELKMNVVGDQGPGQPLGSIAGQASACKVVINDALVYMISKTPLKISRWAAVKALSVMPRAGKDINAFYNRTALKFFFFGDKKTKRNIFSCDCHSVVAHEFGHAYLDILRPDFWSAQAAEIWAYHEAFGDMTAILAMLAYDELIEAALRETDGDMTKSNILTRLAPDMGIGVYNLTGGKNGELPNALRDLSVVYTYTEPERLPQQGRDDKIINECHSFSRIFSGAFYELLMKIGKDIQNKGTPTVAAIKAARDICADYLIRATLQVPATVRLFDAVCRQMMALDRANGGKYQEIMSEVFHGRNLLLQKVLMLDDTNIETLIQSVQDPYEIQVHGETKVVRTLGTRTMKLVDNLGVMALADNPLLDLEIEVPNQTSYYFNESGQLVDIAQANEAEILDSAYACLRTLNEQNLVGKHHNATFENRRGKLVRRQIICKCGLPNYCDPNAPEYGKPWKPKNNAGCVKCHSNCEPRSCDCEGTPTPPPPKLGCYTRVQAGGSNSYLVGSRISRRVC